MIKINAITSTNGGRSIWSRLQQDANNNGTPPYNILKQYNGHNELDTPFILFEEENDVIAFMLKYG